MAQQLTVQACFVLYVFSFVVTSLVWLVRKDNMDRVALTVDADR